MKALLFAALLGFVVACDATGPGDMEMIRLMGPTDTLGASASFQVMAVRINPPEEYRAWYAEVGRCAGLVGRFEAVKWYIVPLPWKGPYGVTMLAQHSNGRIVLNSLMAGNMNLVKHESMHHHVHVNGRTPNIPDNVSSRVADSLGHPDKYFNLRCTGDST